MISIHFYRNNTYFCQNILINQTLLAILGFLISYFKEIGFVILKLNLFF